MNTDPQTIKLVLQASLLKQSVNRPPYVPDGFLGFQTTSRGIRLAAWLAGSGTMDLALGILGTLPVVPILVKASPVETLPDILLGICSRDLRPTLVISRGAFLQEEGSTLETARYCSSGRFQGEQGFALTPDSYLCCWWSTLGDSQAELLLSLDVWYPGVMQRLEINLGMTPTTLATVESNQRPILAAAARPQNWQPLDRDNR